MKKTTINNIRKWALRISGMVLLLAVLAGIAVAVGFSWLVSESGLVWLTAQIEERVSNDDLELEIGEIEELTAGQVVISTITLTEDGEPYVRGEDIRFTYNWRDLLALNPRLQTLKVEKLAIYRLPEEEQSDAAEGFALPTLPEVDIGDFRIEDLMLGPDLTGREEHLAVSGTLISSPTIYRSRFNLQITNKLTGSRLAMIRFNPDQMDDRLNLVIEISDQAGGPLARFFDEKPISLSLKGDGTLAEWNGQLAAQFGDMVANTDIRLDLSGKIIRLVSQGTWTAMGVETDGLTDVRYNPQNGEIQVGFEGLAVAGGYGLQDLGIVLGAEPEEALFDPQAAVRIKAEGTVGQVLSMPEGTPVADLEDIAFEVTLRQKGSALMIEQLDLTHRAGALQATGSVDLSKQALDLAADFTTQDLSVFRPGMAGQAEGTVTLSGSYDPLSLTGDLDLKTQGLATPWQQMKTVFGADPSAEAKFTVSPEGVQIIEGAITGKERLALNGGVSFEEGLSFNLQTAFGGYDIKTTVSLANNVVTASDLDIQGIAGNLKGTLTYDQGSGALDGTLTLQSGDAYHIAVNVSGNAERPVFEGMIKGEAPVPYRFSYSGHASFEPAPAVILESLQGQFASNDLRLQQEAALKLEGETVRLAPAIFVIEGGTLTIEGRLAGEQLSLQASGENLPTDLNITPFILPGKMNGSLTLSGPLNNLAGNATLNLERIAVPGPEDIGQQYLAGTINGSYQNKLLMLQADLGGPAEFNLQAQAQVPLSLVPFELKPDAPVQGEISGNLDLGALALLAGLDRHRLRGQLTLDSTLGGTVNDPAMNGTGLLQNGYYENVITGTILQDMTGQASFAGRQVVIKELRGFGPEGGTFIGSGTVDLTVLADPRFVLELVTDNLQVASLDDLGLTVSAELTASGDGTSALIEGEVNVDYAEYYIDSLGNTSDFAGFTIVERGTPEAEAPLSPEAIKPAYQVKLSGSILANNNIYVRGPDLESEWKADLQVSGTLDDPRLDGRASLIRGRYELFGTPVLFTEGVLRFQKAEPPNPGISLEGTIEGREMDATVGITGDFGNPSISLSSDPPLPQDEILARVLFGNSVDDLSPAQALHIAQMLSSLTGSGARRFDPLNDIRKELGLDVLDIVMDEESGATVSAGKYLNEDVFIAVDQGVTPGSPAVRAEIEVTEDIEVETRFNSTDESSIGVNWKRDY